MTISETKIYPRTGGQTNGILKERSKKSKHYCWRLYDV